MLSGLFAAVRFCKCVLPRVKESIQGRIGREIRRSVRYRPECLSFAVFLPALHIQVAARRWLTMIMGVISKNIACANPGQIDKDVEGQALYKIGDLNGSRQPGGIQVPKELHLRR